MKHPVIKLAQLLNIENPHVYTLYVARWNGRDQPLDVYVRDAAEWQNWNRYRGDRDEFFRDYILSIIDFYPEPDTWLFGGIYKVEKRNTTGNTSSYEITECTEYTPYIGRLKITLPRPPRGRDFYLENYLDDMHVAAILPEVSNSSNT